MYFDDFSCSIAYLCAETIKFRGEMGVNKVILLGYVGNEPEVRYLDRQRCVARVRLATNEYYTNDRGETNTQTEWHTVIFWNKSAQNIEKYVHKGTLLYVEGRLQTRSYEDSAKSIHYVTEILARTFQLLDRSNASSKQNSPSENAAPITSLALEEALSEPLVLEEAPIPF